MLVSIDIGYSHTKAMTVDSKKVIFPSVVGEIQHMQLNLGSKNGYIQLGTQAGEWLIGQGALEQSIYQTRRKDREWINTPEYDALLLGALSELTSASNVAIHLVSGLPVAYFADHQVLAGKLMKSHNIRRAGRKFGQKITLEDVIFLPQGLAAVLSEALDERGKVIPGPLAEGTVGLVDVGGHTVNFATFKELRAITKQTTSIDAGMWTVLAEIGKRINAAFPGQDLAGHELIEVMKTGDIRHNGRRQDVAGIVADVLAPFTRRIQAEITQIWGSAVRLDELLVAGGGAWAIGPALIEKYTQGRIVRNPQWANAEGYLRYGRRKWGM